MPEIIHFSEVGPYSQKLVGGKGYSLGMMTQNGISVPDGFIVTTTVFDRFYDKNFDKIEKDIFASFEKLGCEFVAVRSSANCEDSLDNSFAGQFDSFLNTSRENLIDNIKKCWDSLNSQRCQEYLSQRNINKKSVKVAVMIQKMVQSEVAGVAFTINPVTNDTDQVVIEAAYGLGEAVVSGQITPDNYIWDKLNNKIVNKKIEKQTKGLFKDAKNKNKWQKIGTDKQNVQILTDSQITDLVDVVYKIKNYYNHDCDIEWAFADGRFYITQSRPITTIEQKDIFIETYEETEKILPYLAIPLVNTTSGLSKYNLANYTKLGMNYKGDSLYPLMLKKIKQIWCLKVWWIEYLWTEIL